MNIFFCAHDIIEFDGKNYYSNPISYMVDRYADDSGIFTCFAPIKKVVISKSQQIVRKNIRFIDSPQIKGLNDFKQINKYYDSIKCYLQENDIAIIHIHVSLINTLCVLAAEKSRIPYLTVVVGCAWDALWNHSIKGKFMAPFCYLLEKWCQRKSKYSIYVTKKFLQNRYPTSGKSIACSNVELNFAQKSHRRQYIKDGIINIATVAAVDVRYKGQQYVIKALAKLGDKGKNIIYHLVGDGNIDYLQDYAKKLGVSDQVVFHGPLPHDQIADFLDSIDIYVQPSKQEGLPRSVIEAMSRGCLCIGSRIAGIPELLPHKYLFKAGDSSAISEIIQKISVADLEMEGKRNIEKANEYSKECLDKRRSDFITLFKQNTKS